MAEQIVYTVGGTVQAGGGTYIKRKADDELLILCRKGDWASILSSRQVGKSSLMVRTAQELEKENICSVIVDLSAIGVNVSPEQWYLGILSEIANGLKLKTNVFEWWQEHKQLGTAQRFVTYFRDILLNEVEARIVLFFDEIDSTLSMPFSRDDFFAALRSIYNSRSTNPNFLRLSIVLVGVATPNDLIMDKKRTPYNIGRRVELTDFTLEEAQLLSGGLGMSGEEVLKWIFEWTGGHPYLTQLVCFYMAKSGESFTKAAVQDSIEKLFMGEQGRQDNNLRFVSDMLTKRAPDIQRVLKTYKDIRSGKAVHDNERSAIKAHLKISGVVKLGQNGHLVPRNRIYENAFDLNWIKENAPRQTSYNIVIASSSVFILILAMLVLTGRMDSFIFRPLPMEFVLIPEGRFLMGSENPNESPIHNVYLNMYSISKYEVTNRQYYQCVRAGFCISPHNDIYAAPGSENYPVTDVDWHQAITFCDWSGARLPSEAEWERAARGENSRTYPWGEGIDCALANFGGCTSGLSIVGSYKNGVTSEGVYDMAGNVWEWTSSLYLPYPFNVNDGREDLKASGDRVLKGGSSVDNSSFIRSSYRISVNPAYSDSRTGFRCALSE